jgi:uncharacterized protein (DUF1778 family)
MAKDTYIRFRLTETEKELVKRAAKRLNMSMSDFVRSYVVQVSRTIEDVSLGAIGIDMAADVLRYNITSILKSAKRTARILKRAKPRKRTKG